MVPGPTRLCSFKRPGAQCAIERRMARGHDLGAWRRSRPPDRAPASQVRTPARPRSGLAGQNAGMTEPSDQVCSMYCLT